MMSDDDIDRLLSLPDMPHVPYPPTHTEEVVILSKADYDALVASQAAPDAMPEDVIEDIMTLVTIAEERGYMLSAERVRVWLDAQKEAADAK